MDADRFATLTRALTAAGSRRGALAALAGALGLRGLAQPENAAAAKSGKCKPTCGECETCKKGDCERKNGKKTCKKGKCRPKPTGASCKAFPVGACQKGTCVNLQADEANCGSLGTVCMANQVCQAGSCFSRSDCPATTTTMCTGGGPTPVSCGNPECYCSLSTEGNLVCIWVDTTCADYTPCTTSATCPAGEACVEAGSCCPGGTPTHACFPRCSTPTVA